MSDTGPRQTIGVVVLTYQGIDMLRRCIAGLMHQSCWPLPVLIVDNASGTEEARIAAQEVGQGIEWLQMATNEGVPGGYNAGLQWASERGLTHILLLNHDVELTDPRLVSLLARAAVPSVAATGPTVLDADGTPFTVGGTLSLWTGTTGHIRTVSAHHPYPALWIDGSCMLVSVDAARRIGGFAPQYFMYWEEVDWCVRARRHGYSVLVEPAASLVHHRGSLSLDRRVRRQLRANAILFERRNATRSQQVTMLLHFLTLGAARDVAIARRHRGGIRDEIAARLYALRTNVRDARRAGWRLSSDGPTIGGRGPTPSDAGGPIDSFVDG